MKRNYHCSARIDALFSYMHIVTRCHIRWDGCRRGCLHLYIILVFGRLSEVRAPAVACWASEFYEVTSPPRGNQDYGMQTRDLATASMCMCHVYALLCGVFPVESHGVRRKAAASDHNLFRHDEIKCSAKAPGKWDSQSFVLVIIFAVLYSQQLKSTE